MPPPKQHPDVDGHELLSGFVRLHVLHHAAAGPLVGSWMLEELAHHGHHISPGTLYPMLHALERRGYLRSTGKRAGRRKTREYRTTAAGDRALAAAKVKLKELFKELIEDDK